MYVKLEKTYDILARFALTFDNFKYFKEGRELKKFLLKDIP